MKYPLDTLGDLLALEEDMMAQASAFILACYDQREWNSLTEARQRIWSCEGAKNQATAPKLATLPPTTEAFRQNVLRAHLQATIWRNCNNWEPSNLNPEESGFYKEDLKSQ